MRHLTSDITRIQAAGFQPAVGLETGVQRYLDWIRSQGSVREYFAEASGLLRDKGMVQRVRA
jgi:dTDP-L-rhamnose 4-epimerase